VIRNRLFRLGILALAFSVCLTPEMLMAQQSTPPQDQPLQNQSNLPQQLSNQPAQPQETQQQQEQQEQEQQQNQNQNQAQPAETLPNAPSAQQQNANAQQQKQGTSTPLGTAAAEKGATYGGAASRPAGAAIAPAKQKQSRSLLIKIGAIAAGLAALGTIYALTRTSPSTPPNSGAALSTPQP
jgi:hypothetical protein